MVVGGQRCCYRLLRPSTATYAYNKRQQHSTAQQLTLLHEFFVTAHQQVEEDESHQKTVEHYQADDGLSVWQMSLSRVYSSSQHAAASCSIGTCSCALNAAWHYVRMG